MREQLSTLMQQAQRMQESLQRVQEQMAHVEITGQAGGGMVTVTMTGRMAVRRVRIDRALFGDDDDMEMLEDLVVAAMNDAVNKAHEAMQAKVAEVGIPLPSGFKVPGIG